MGDYRAEVTLTMYGNPPMSKSIYFNVKVIESAGILVELDYVPEWLLNL